MPPLPVPLKTLLSGGIVENARIEFKASWNPEASLKTICAFANDLDNWGGGYIVIGVREDGTRRIPEGIAPEKLDAFQKDILNKCRLIRPQYDPVVATELYDGKHFIVIWAPGGSSRPYASPLRIGKKDGQNVYWIRKMASTVLPNDDELNDLFNLAAKVPFDDRVNPHADLSDLNITLIQSFLRETGSALFEASRTMDFADLCESMRIVNPQPEYRKPTNVGLMFFSLEPDKFFPYAQIDVVELLDETGSNIRERTFKGPLHQQLREALQFIQNMYLVEFVSKVDDKAEARRFFNYPYAALEEALSNAVYHKGYDVREPIEVRIHPDEIVVISHPGADRSISLDDLKGVKVHSRRYRNRRIGEFLKELRLTEGRNTGFRKIRTAMSRNGSPPPVFETDEDRTYFITTLPIHPEASQDTECSQTSSAERRTENCPAQDDLSDEEKKLREYALQHPFATNAQVAADLDMSRRKLDRTINSLKSKGVLRKEGPPRRREWIICQ